MRVWLLATLLALGIAGSSPAQTQPLLQLQGQPYFGGSMTLSLSGAVGQPALLAFGLNPLPLDQPLQTGKGPWYIGSLVNLVALGNIPSGGRIDMPFTMPPLTPALAGIPIVMQGYVPSQLSNPATLPLDNAYLVSASALVLSAPSPQQLALFGDKIAAGDFNADGKMDIAVGAWWEDVGGIDKAGAVHVYWGPTFVSSLLIASPVPTATQQFGLGLCVADLNTDGVADLIIGESAGGDPPAPDAKGQLHVYSGGTGFSVSPTFSLMSLGQGSAMGLYGRILQAGDLDGNGFLDVISGVPYSAPNGVPDAGHIEVFYGPSFQTGVFVHSPEPADSAFFGSAIAVGDINGDGVADLLEASSREDAGGIADIGRFRAFDGPSLQPILTLENPLPAGANSRFGNVLVGVDVNGDGRVELVVTDQRDHAFLFWSPSYSNYALIKRAPDPGSTGGPSVSFGYFAAVGDANGDGLTDIVIGEPYGAGVGRVHVALGPYWQTMHVIKDKLPLAGAHFGWGVLLKDVDGNGLAELLCGSELAPAGQTSGAGHVTVLGDKE